MKKLSPVVHARLGSIWRKNIGTFVLAWLPAFAMAQAGLDSAGPLRGDLIDDLVIANKILYQQGVVDGFGHVSVRHDRDPDRFVMARSVAPFLVTADDLIEYTLDGQPVNLEGRDQYSERFIHAEIYRMRPDVQAIVHNHSPNVVPFGVSSVPLQPVYHMAPFIADGVPVFDLRTDFGMTDMLINNPERGRALALTLGNHAAVLIRGHGAAVVGPALPFAVGRSIYLEMNAKIQLQAMSLGGSVTYLDPAEGQAMLDAGENRGYERPWQMWKSQAAGEE